MTIEKMIEDGKATIIDVRSPLEYMSGHASDTLNIPLNELPERLQEFKGMQQPLILCCASGNRSGQACSFLQSHDIECYNAGSWYNVNVVKSQLIK